jgi:hypothetical protein
MGKVPSALEMEIAGEKAAALGHSGRRLRAALDRVAKFDLDATKRRRAGTGTERRAELVAQAGEAYWSYIVQREALGLVDNESVVEEYGIPPEVARSMRPRLGRVRD